MCRELRQGGKVSREGKGQQGERVKSDECRAREKKKIIALER